LETLAQSLTCRPFFLGSINRRDLPFSRYGSTLGGGIHSCFEGARRRAAEGGRSLPLPHAREQPKSFMKGLGASAASAAGGTNGKPVSLEPEVRFCFLCRQAPTQPAVVVTGWFCLLGGSVSRAVGLVFFWVFWLDCRGSVAMIAAHDAANRPHT
jgi:hypothetical protein